MRVGKKSRYKSLPPTPLGKIESWRPVSLCARVLTRASERPPGASACSPYSVYGISSVSLAACAICRHVCLRLPRI